MTDETGCPEDTQTPLWLTLYASMKKKLSFGKGRCLYITNTGPKLSCLLRNSALTAEGERFNKMIHVYMGPSLLSAIWWKSG